MKDAYFNEMMVEVAGKLAATDNSQESWEVPESQFWSNHEQEVTGKPVSSRSSGYSRNCKPGCRKVTT